MGGNCSKNFGVDGYFDEAIDKISKVPYASTEYAIVSGVQKGQIISRNPDSVAYQPSVGPEKLRRTRGLYNNNKL